MSSARNARTCDPAVMPRGSGGLTALAAPLRVAGSILSVQTHILSRPLPTHVTSRCAQVANTAKRNPMLFLPLSREAAALPARGSQRGFQIVGEARPRRGDYARLREWRSVCRTELPLQLQLEGQSMNVSQVFIRSTTWRLNSTVCRRHFAILAILSPFAAQCVFSACLKNGVQSIGRRW
jgi:hypothetical protein